MDNVTQQEREDGARAKLYRLSNGFGFVWRMPLHLVATRLNRRLYCFGFTCGNWFIGATYKENPSGN